MQISIELRNITGKLPCLPASLLVRQAGKVYKLGAHEGHTKN